MGKSSAESVAPSDPEQSAGCATVDGQTNISASRQRTATDETRSREMAGDRRAERRVKEKGDESGEKGNEMNRFRGRVTEGRCARGSAVASVHTKVFNR